ncbi:MAG: sulfite exporter TauE/SafE family protein [Hyphomicrobiaceae bacterium]
MQIYLPIAELSVNVLIILAMGGAVGFLSGMFGVGGGFLITPLLIFMGISPAVAVATGANQVVASSVSGALTQWRRQNVDVKLGTIMLTGGILGSIGGVQIVKILRALGQIDLFISLTYVTFLGIIGALMLIESVNALLRNRQGSTAQQRRQSHRNWLHKLPLKQRFHRSKLYISAIPPFALGVLVGFLSAIMGVGGGFVIVPAMIYLLKVPTNVVFGTSLFQTVFVGAFTTIMQAYQNQTVDAVLAGILIVSGVIGAQIGVQTSARLKAEQLRAILALLVLAVAVRLAFGLIVRPEDIFSIAPVAVTS